ncbi:MAG: GNAT family N-acetyltransferase [Candidatus Doudnabacteria bacterium]|nr:GNAT family N-acetyltransferase [Candidatus Doudnabacteria bacterium]
MEIKTQTIKDCFAVKITAHEDDKQVGRLYLYMLKNDLHKEPFGFLEDVFVAEEYRKQGIGTELVKTAIEEAKRQGCYKLICTSREASEKIHAFYKRLGFKKWGFEFRMDLK